MVFGNLGPTSGTGVAFTRDPSTGETGDYGDYLVNAQGEDVVAGIRNTLSLADLEEVDPVAYGELRQAMRRLETHYRDLCDIEFTIERGKLWMLQTRVGKRTAPAAFRIACQLVDEHLITMDEALSRVNGAQLSQLLFPQFDADGERTLLTRAMAASPGAAVGMAVFDSVTAQEWAEEGKDVILVRRETNPDDLRRHDRRRRHPDRTRRQDLARRRGRPRHGPHRGGGRRGARHRHGRRARSRSPATRSTRATSSRSTAPPATSSSAPCPSCPPPSAPTSRRGSTSHWRRPTTRRPATW